MNIKKTIAVVFIASLVAIPGVLFAGEQVVIADASTSIQPTDETSIIVIVNPTLEQVLSADKQILSSEAENNEDTADGSAEETQPSTLPEEDDNTEITSEKAEPTFDIPVTMNEKVEAYIHYFTNRIRDKFSIWLSRSEMYLPMMKKTFKEKGLPEDLTYLALIESGFNNKAYSRAKAAGQWQFIKGTGKRYGLRIDNWIDERRDPEKATEAAAEYLSDLYGMFNDWHLAAAGYNAGEGKIGRAIHKYKTVDFWQLSQKKNRYLRRETKDYVPKLIAAAMIAKDPAKYGFNDIASYDPIIYERVSINRVMDLRDIAKAIDYSVEDIKLLNPELKTNLTPPNYPRYELKVPMGKKAALEEKMDSITPVSEKTILKEMKGFAKSNPHKRKASRNRSSSKKVS